MEKINLVKILKNCPSGMELECASYDNVSFDKISDDKKATYPIFCYITDEEGNRSSISFTENGCESKRYGAKCVIFPKGKTTWEGFQRPFKDGDIVAYGNPHGDNSQVFIFKDRKEHHTLASCYLMLDDDKLVLEEDTYYITRLATEKEKQKLFQAIEKKGYKWNAETKTLEKLIVPKFKIGDEIKWKGHDAIGRIEDIKDSVYHVDFGYDDGVVYVGLRIQDDYELVPNKFDISSLIPFESRVLFRNTGEDIWKPAIFGCYLKDKSAPYYALGGTCWRYCIPFDANEHLLGTTNDCDEFYKNWE